MAITLDTTVTPFTIAIGTALSAQLNCGGLVVAGLDMDPSAWTAASVTFQSSPDGGSTWENVFTVTGAELTLTGPAAGQYIAIDPALFRGMPCLKVRSGTSGTPVNQLATRSLQLVTISDV